MTIGEKVESDHQPPEVNVKEEAQKERRKTRELYKNDSRME